MNIAFDATAILGPMSKNRGIGIYTLSQFKTMIQNDKKNHYFLFNCFEPFHLFEQNTNMQEVNLFEQYFYMGKNYYLMKDEHHKELFGCVVKKFIKNNKIDLFYITSPFENHCHIYDKSWFNGVKTIATVYDIIPYVFQEHYLADKTTYNWYMKCIEMLYWCDKCFVISNSVKEDLINYFNFNSSKIECIWGAVDERYRKVSIADNDKKYFEEKYGISGDFVMCTGGDDKRKNIAGLIKAYSKIGKDLINRYQLVIVCKLSEEAIDKYKNMAVKYNIYERVILTNFVSYEDLVKLYNMADLMAFPSQYEGFGLPVVEAFACGTPVLTSNNSSLGEIAGNAAYLVDPFDIEDITRGIIEALKDSNKELMIQKGFKRLEKFQWSVVAKSAIDCINTLEDKDEKLFKEKKKIAFFTPLPPIQSGISDYSVDILNELSKYFNIDVFIDDGYKYQCELNNNIKVYNYKKFPLINNYFEIIYQMGNSEYHFFMYTYIKEYPGTVVLHDYNLHGAVHYNAFIKRNNDWEKYRTYLLEDFPKEKVDKYIEELKVGKIELKIHEMELNGFVTNYAHSIIVHSNDAKEKLLKKNIARKVKTIRSYAIITPLLYNKEKRQKIGYQETEIVLASFGHLHETKRVIPILKAFEKLCHKYHNIRLIFVGKLSDNIAKEFNEFIYGYNLMKKVEVTGFVDLEKFIDYIDITDICLNLRYPYNGETSGSLMRLLAKGKCVLINNIGSFSEIPDAACVKLPNVEYILEKEEIQYIYNSIEELLEEPGKIPRIGKEARHYAEENLDISIICKQYADCIFDKEKNELTEEKLIEIQKKEVAQKLYTEPEIKMLAQTLAYTKIN